ncbi:MAG: VOC family protein, partial [Myxococcales bacterium]|nr:VOC family protein [Myxococcales bacterium]
MKFRFGEINVVCTDRDRSLAFYRNVLGFEVL